MTVEHSTLTGSSLHENKGAASASDDYVATVTSGATVWKKLTASNLTTTGNSFGGQLLHVQDVKASGTAGQSIASANNIRVLNTVKTNEITSASLASNQVTLPAGTYYVDAWASSYAAGATRLYWWNVGAGTIVATGQSAYQNPSSIDVGFCTVRGRFTIVGSTIFELRQHTSSPGAGSTGGFANSLTGNGEIYVDVSIWKVA